MDLLFVWCFSFLCYVKTQEPAANLPQGRVVGIKVFPKNSYKPIEVFFGIPYATPPIGRLRFSPPERHSGWRRTYYAHRMPPRCPHSGNDSNVNEDCLYLNIWTPRTGDGKLLPVMIILYSDSWIKNGVILPCEDLAADGVVVVTVSYRLHILSFFTFKSTLARGNLALLDQYMALIWVRENIAAFGGDLNNISLLGHSAGADSVLLHIVSPRTKGLFHRAIIMSPQNIWKAIGKNSLQNNSFPETLSRTISKTLGCSKDTDDETLQCLKDKSLTDLIKLYSNSWDEALQPIPDDFLPKSEQYLPKALDIAMATLKSSLELDVLMGTTDLEAINDDYNYSEVFDKKETGLTFSSVTSVTIPNILRLYSLERADISAVLTQIIQWEFLGPKIHVTDSEKDIMKFVETVARMETSAKWEAACALLAAQLARRVSHLYVYHYRQPSSIDLNGRRLNVSGATHGAELIALLGDSLTLQIARRPTSQSEKEISLQFRNYITNFVKFGFPGTQKEWPRYVVGDSYIHEVCNNMAPDCSAYKNSKAIAFWLRYLPRISNILISNEQAEKITSANDGSRLRGGVLAMCGVLLIFILLLIASVIILHKWRTRRPTDIDCHVSKL